ncbi:hypothetical protein AZA_87591 [Nitrospirillum viridazoti Y2]|nr:hypothetical protein AZA_87591 [Nitrospirillum amazonense Y2]
MRAAPAAKGSRAPKAVSQPRAATDRTMPHSTPGRAKPLAPATAPATSSARKARGHSQMARAPCPPLACWPAHRPTAVMAAKWSSPPKGWAKPSVKPWVWPGMPG